MFKHHLERHLGRVGAILAELGGGLTLPTVTLLMLAASLAEVVGVASIAPFVGYAATGEIASPLVRDLVARVPIASPLVVLGAASFLALLVGNILQAATTYAIYRLTWRAGETLSSRIFEGLLLRPFSAFLASNSSEQLTGLLHNVTSAVGNVLIPLLATVARLLSTLAILVLLVAINPTIAGLAFVVAASGYVLAFRLLSPRIASRGRRSYALRTRMYQVAAEVFEAVREVKVFASEAYFTRQFAEMSRASGAADAQSQMMRQLPRYLIEVVAFGGMIAIVMALVSTAGNSNAVWPLLALYAVAAWRLLPAAQQVFGNVTSIRHHWPALASLNKALEQQGGPALPAVGSGNTPSPPPETTAGPRVLLENVTFAYDGAAQPVFRGFDLSIGDGEVVGIVGRSGGGKTTLLALCLGLLEPQSGRVMLGGVPAREALRGRRIAYVPQQPAFQDDSLRRNVAFGLADAAIDDARIDRALAAVGLASHVSGLPQGLDTRIGERGQSLSGGQRQRLALARALYLDPDLLVLDEFTSALDAATERELLDTLAAILRGRTALIVTHRAEVLSVCNRVVEL